MSARDELFRLIAGRTATTAVNAIIAAGYTKPEVAVPVETAEQRRALGRKDACYERHMLAPGIHQDVPHLHERIDL